MAGARVSWTESLVVGVVVFGLAGTAGTLGLLAALIAYLRTDDGLWGSLDPATVSCAAASASLVGVLTWRFTVGAEGASRWRGALAGLTVGLAAHPVCWLFYSVYAVASGVIGGGFSVRDLATTAVGVTVVATIWSVCVVGGITAPLGALLGYLVQGFKPSDRRGTPSVAD